MKDRNRNTALVLIFAGLFLLLGNIFGFLIVASLILIWFGVDRIRIGEKNKGYLLLVIGVIILISNHMMFVVGLVLIIFGYFYMKSDKQKVDETFIEKQNLVQSVKWNKNQWTLKNMMIRSIVGEIHMDVSHALIDERETTIILQGVVGDIDIIVPDHIGVTIDATLIVGEIGVNWEKEAGMMNKFTWASPNYASSDIKLNFMISYIVGDIDIKII
ncbi:cell wall-active antibiotics response protein LiaF [Chengkuizengella axinellae]|uniref:Cell wall-active antibiotics response protein LiaF n=1 Tax=Chengkuizengella axinellae TaxID=3064388 RepID=A0ABT9IT51_9BACL|nr:cell wall-active antibiotics response protein LiaF [Chengkuizengella sp. 2205SS18-9]MDP5272513.1 cell wall-active antibiotics response protein LiaF [Chengkuizengella sp. 2205SS18-9]